MVKIHEFLRVSPSELHAAEVVMQREPDLNSTYEVYQTALETIGRRNVQYSPGTFAIKQCFTPKHRDPFTVRVDSAKRKLGRQRYGTTYMPVGRAFVFEWAQTGAKPTGR